LHPVRDHTWSGGSATPIGTTRPACAVGCSLRTREFIKSWAAARPT
jgi:hypothetical protein